MSRHDRTACPVEVAREVPERPNEFVDDREVGVLARARERVEVERDDPFTEGTERFGPVPVLQRDETDVRDEDAGPVDERAVRRQPRDPGRRVQPQEVPNSGVAQRVRDEPHPPGRTVEQIDLYAQRREDALESCDRLRRQGRDVAVHADHRAPRRPEPLGGGLRRASGARARPLPEEIVERLPAAVGDESLGHDEALPGRVREARPHEKASIPRMSRRQAHRAVREAYAPPGASVRPLVAEDSSVVPFSRASSAAIRSSRGWSPSSRVFARASFRLSSRATMSRPRSMIRRAFSLSRSRLWVATRYVSERSFVSWPAD